MSEENKKASFEEIKKRYDDQTDVLYAASRLWVDGIIDPPETRKVVSYCIELTNTNPDMKKFNVGIIQT